jgi:RNA polymerase sigma factor (TIGR02999 family)
VDQHAPKEVTQLLQAWSDGDAAALDLLLPLVEAELQRQARAFLRRERSGHSLESKALVNEAFLRLLDGPVEVSWRNRAQFFGIAGRVMRRVLVDHARRRLAGKRGGIQVTLGEDWLAAGPRGLDWADLLDLHEALDRLAELEERYARVVEMKFFAGLDQEEIGEVLGVSPTTVKRDWRAARAWLLSELGKSGAE